MPKLKRLAALLVFAGMAWALIKLSTFGWNFFAPAYPGGATLTSPGKLEEDVAMLSVSIGPRDLYNNNRDRLRAAEVYIAARLRAAGCRVEFQDYPVSGTRARNIIGIKRGVSTPGEEIIIGAHYDTENNPGADDNASGVAGLLALADYARGKSYSRTVKFVAFTNEEPPFFRTPEMGSAVYAKAARERGDGIKAVLVLEMIGFFSEKHFSQRYPPLIGPFLPSKGNYIAQISDLGSRRLAKRIDRAYREASRLPLQSVTLPAFVPGVDFSDHRNFWKEGYPAVMFTDTAFYRSPHYHKSTDLPGTLDFAYMAAFVDGLRAALDDLAGEAGPPGAP